MIYGPLVIGAIAITGASAATAGEEDDQILGLVLAQPVRRSRLVAGGLLFLQCFGLGGVIATFGLVFDLIGFLLSLIFVLVSSAVLFRRDGRGRLYGITTPCNTTGPSV